MLSSLRNQSKSIVVKVLLVLLVLSFGAWGIGDYVTGGGATGNVATVGDREISNHEFAAEYRREFLRLRQVFGNNLTPEAARSFGIPMSVAQRMVQDEVLYQTARNAGLSASDALVLETIQGMDEFNGLTGNFDEQVFLEAIGRAGFSQAGFVERVRRDIVTEAYVTGLLADPIVPDALADRLYRHNEEVREVLVAAIPETAVPAAEVPDSAAVTAYFEENRENFRAPAYRSVTLIEIGPDSVVDEISISDEEIATRYDERAGEFAQNAARDVSQIVLDSETDASTAVSRMSGGETFEDVAQAMAGLSAADTALGLVGRNDLPFEELVEPIFAANEGDIVGPVESFLGWHVFRINEVREDVVQPLEDVRDQLVDELRQERALDRVFDLANSIDEEIGNGATLEEVSENLNLALSRIDAMDATASNPDGADVDAPADPAFAANVFAEELGFASTLIETDTGYYVFRADDETPARPKELDEVRADVISNIMAARRVDAGRQVATELRDAAIEPTAFEAAATAINASVERWDALKRNGDGVGDLNAYRDALVPIFNADQGEAIVVRAGAGFAVVYVDSIRAPEPGVDQEAVTALRDQIQSELRGDLSDLLVRQLAERYDASIDLGAIDREAF